MCTCASVGKRSISRDSPSGWWRGGSWGNAWPKAVSPPSIRRSLRGLSAGRMSCTGCTACGSRPRAARVRLLAVRRGLDPSTLEATDRFIEAVKTAPVFLLFTFRPEFFPSWLDQPHVTMIRIDRLGRDKASARIGDLAGGKELPAEVLEPIISKTDGVPLFVEELTKMVHQVETAASGSPELESGWCGGKY